MAASFAHLHSFQQLPPDYVRDDTCIDATGALGGRESGYAKYWDDNAVISELIFEVEEAVQAAPKKPKDKKKERRDPVLKGGVCQLLISAWLRLMLGMDLEGMIPDDAIKPLAPTALKDSLAPISLSLKSSKAPDIGDSKRVVVAFKPGSLLDLIITDILTLTISF